MSIQHSSFGISSKGHNGSGGPTHSYFRWDEEFHYELPHRDQSPLEIKLIEHTTGRVVGTACVDLSTLLYSDYLSDIEGWFPLIDKQEGIKGEI